MRKRHLVALVVCALALQSGAAAIGARGFPLRTTPAADSQFDVRAHGATGDGKTLDTDAINRAIDAAAAAGGGTVVFPAGTYLSTSIHLKSHVALFIGHGAAIDLLPFQLAGFHPPGQLRLPVVDRNRHLDIDVFLLIPLVIVHGEGGAGGRKPSLTDFSEQLLKERAYLTIVFDYIPQGSNLHGLHLLGDDRVLGHSSLLELERPPEFDWPRPTGPRI